MRIAVASGKGGTGKTTIAIALAQCAEPPVRLLDCDVEEPDCHLFLKPDILQSEQVGVPCPEVDESLCDGCGKCGDICQFNAIVTLGSKAMTFPELCHGCGACSKVCPSGAIREVDREVGVVEIGARNGIEFVQGRLDVGQAMSPPVIRAVKRHARDDGLTILDCPPGAACPFVVAVRGCDFVILVTEPTPFGLHDLRIAIDTIREMGLPFGVVINRSDCGDDRVDVHCRKENIPILARIKEDRRVAEAYSRGETLVEAVPAFRSLIKEVLEKVKQTVRRTA